MPEVTDRDLAKILKVAQDYDRLKKESLIHDWSPLPKQWEYLNSKAKVKTFCACNQGGKTSTAVFEEASHLTGIYHKDWQGVRYNHPVITWICGESTDRVRDTLQEKLFGPIGQWGTGMIPKECIDFKSIVMRSGTTGAIHKARIKHIPSGGWSEIQFFSYDQGRDKFQGSTIHRLLNDEEPPGEIVGEQKMRLAFHKGHLCFTYTPLSGYTKNHEWLMESDDVARFNITMDDLPWMDEASIEHALEGLPDYEKRARRYGIAATSSGLIYQFPDEQYTCEAFDIPKHWPRISGFDCGINHPSTAVSLAWDREADCVYIYQEYWSQGKTAPEVAMTLKHWSTKFVLPHDARKRDNMGTDNTVAALYEREGFDVITGDHDRWGRVEKVRAMIATGRLFIFKERCPHLLKEMRTYRTKNDGRTILRKDDDTISAFEHAVQFHDKADMGKKEVVKFTINQYKPYSGKGVV